jgi:hypothetical protein
LQSAASLLTPTHKLRSPFTKKKTTQSRCSVAAVERLQRRDRRQQRPLYRAAPSASQTKIRNFWACPAPHVMPRKSCGAATSAQDLARYCKLPHCSSCNAAMPKLTGPALEARGAAGVRSSESEASNAYNAALRTMGFERYFSWYCGMRKNGGGGPPRSAGSLSSSRSRLVWMFPAYQKHS